LVGAYQRTPLRDAACILLACLPEGQDAALCRALSRHIRALIWRTAATNTAPAIDSPDAHRAQACVPLDDYYACAALGRINMATSSRSWTGRMTLLAAHCAYTSWRAARRAAVPINYRVFANTQPSRAVLPAHVGLLPT